MESFKALKIDLLESNDHTGLTYLKQYYTNTSLTLNSHESHDVVKDSNSRLSYKKTLMAFLIKKFNTLTKCQKNYDMYNKMTSILYVILKINLPLLFKTVTFKSRGQSLKVRIHTIYLAYFDCIKTYASKHNLFTACAVNSNSQDMILNFVVIIVNKKAEIVTPLCAFLFAYTVL